jgi:hypothetical protein
MRNSSVEADNPHLAAADLFGSDSTFIAPDRWAWKLEDDVKPLSKPEPTFLLKSQIVESLLVGFRDSATKVESGSYQQVPPKAIGFSGGGAQKFARS